MTLNQLADVILHDLSGGIPARDSNLDRRDIIVKARPLFSALLKPLIYEKKNEGDNSAITQAIYSYELTLQENDARQKYVTIPDNYMALAYGKGVWRVYAKGNPYSDYVIQHNPGVTSNLPHMQLPNIQYCFIEGKRVVFGKGCKAKKADKIIVQIINPMVDAIADTDPIPAPNEIINEVITRLKAEYAPLLAVPADMANNQNPNIK